MRRLASPAARELLLLLLVLAGLLALIGGLDHFGGGGPRPTRRAPWSAGELALLLLVSLALIGGYGWRRCREYRRLRDRLQAAEAACRERERRLRFVVGQAPLVLFALDATGVFTMVEGRGLAAAGHAPRDLLGHSIFAVFADAPQMLADARRALAGEEFTAVTPGARAVFETRHTVLRDERGAVAGVFGVAFDVTARERATAAWRACETQRGRELLLLRRLQVGLTPQEGRVLDLLDEGAGNTAIAAQLHIQPDTVARHIHNLGVKLGLTGGPITRQAVLAEARRQGLCPAHQDAPADLTDPQAGLGEKSSPA